MTGIAAPTGRADVLPPIQDAAPTSDLFGQKVAALLACVVIFVLSAFLDALNGYEGVIILSALVLLAFPGAGQSSLGSTIVFCGFALFTMPYIGLIYVGYDVQTAWFALFIIFSMALVAFGESSVQATGRPGHGPFDLTLILIYLIGGLAVWTDDGLGQISFYAGWAIALVHLERVHVRSASFLYRGVGLLFFVTVIGLFVAFLWAGGGRIVQLSFILAPLFLTVYYQTFRLSGLVLATSAVALSFAGRVVRFGWSDGIAGLSEDSGASPITLTSYLWQTKDVVFASGTIYEQWLLLFVNWFPRNLWPSKPIGIGSSFVDLFFGRTGVSAEHNIAIGMFGEHLFYLPNGWIVSVVALVAVTVMLRRTVIRICSPYRAPVIAFDVWLITLFWGGMAAFSARVWFALIPVIPYVMFIKWLKRSRVAPTGPLIVSQPGVGVGDISRVT